MKIINYEELIYQIIRQACEDYFGLHSWTKTAESDCNIEELESFFRSRYFSLMWSGSDPEALMVAIRRVATTPVEYDVAKDADGYYVFRLADEEMTPIHRYKTRGDAISKAAELQGVSVTTYSKMRRRDGMPGAYKRWD